MNSREKSSPLLALFGAIILSWIFNSVCQKQTRDLYFHYYRDDFHRQEFAVQLRKFIYSRLPHKLATEKIRADLHEVQIKLLDKLC